MLKEIKLDNKERMDEFTFNMLLRLDDEPEFYNGGLAEMNPSHGQQEAPI